MYVVDESHYKYGCGIYLGFIPPTYNWNTVLLPLLKDNDQALLRFPSAEATG
jgi:hypothetical protein